MATSTPVASVLRWTDACGNVYQPKRAFYDVAASQTASTLVAAVTGKVIVVIGCTVLCGGTATTLTFNSASAAISGAHANGANGGFCWPTIGGTCGYLQTIVSEALTVTTGAGSTTTIDVTWVEV